ncbi:hypothetical protein P3T18_001047 [Paraburkholderia sp. GAS199]|uniref:DUF3717 domain-containing protein n=1 Tax=Paraburkholderia sp. GAS199 TaxID=3035126 RepID=UPI003D1DBD5C
MSHSTPIPNGQRVSIARIEHAINVWRNAQATISDTPEILALDDESRCLADIYGMMIFNGLESIPLDALSEHQLDALTVAEA